MEDYTGEHNVNQNTEYALAAVDHHDRSALLEKIEINKENLRKNHHGLDCIICFERNCVCKPR